MQDKKKIQILISWKGKIKDDYIVGVNDRAIPRDETFSIIYGAGTDLTYAD